MLSITIQPKSYKKEYTIEDIDRIVVLKFQHKALLQDDFRFKCIYDTNEIDDELISYISENIKNNNVITYSGNMLYYTINAILEHKDHELIDRSSIIGLMEILPHMLKLEKRKWLKLKDALEILGYDGYVDTSDPLSMSENSIILYRLMQEKFDFEE